MTPAAPHPARDPATGLPVPWVTAWSEETRDPTADLIVRPDRTGVAYSHERPDDRAHEVLWDRVVVAPGRGEPHFRLLHSGRQRRAMLDLLCQHCGRPASRTPDGTLFVLPDEPRFRQADSLTRHPPVCVPHAHLAAGVCPALRRHGHVAVRAHRCTPWGVFGTHYHPGASGPEPNEEMELRFGDPELPWMVAGQIVLRLRRAHVVDLASEGRDATPPPVADPRDGAPARPG